jgi:hypothetical protein
MKLVRVHNNGSSRKAWGCPRTKNRSNWCYRMCVPHDGVGQCGRVAPHAVMGRTQQAILARKASQQA